jgi:hypothetical protein
MNEYLGKGGILFEMLAEVIGLERGDRRKERVDNRTPTVLLCKSETSKPIRSAGKREMTEGKRATKTKPKRGARGDRAEKNHQIVLDPAVPGQALEKAGAEIVSHAGRTFVDGIARLFGARFAGWIAENEAKAEARRLAIQTDARIDQARSLTDERHRQELEEIRHQETKALAERRLDRLLIEMAREQANFEAIAAHAVKQIEHDPQRDKPRELDDDWMFRFARYAQHVSDIDLQEIWARILASAAVEDRQRISAAALQTISLMDRRAATDFEKFCRVLVTLSWTYPLHEGSHQSEPQGINLRTLQELGLIEEARESEYSFPEFKMKIGQGDIRDIVEMSHSRLQLTQRGVEIAQALFSQQGSQMFQDDNLAMQYLKDAISANVTLFNQVEIFPKQVSYSLRISQRPAAQFPLREERSPIVVEGASGRLPALAKRELHCCAWSEFPMTLAAIVPATPATHGIDRRGRYLGNGDLPSGDRALAQHTDHVAAGRHRFRCSVCSRAQSPPQRWRSTARPSPACHSISLLCPKPTPQTARRLHRWCASDASRARG